MKFTKTTLALLASVALIPAAYAAPSKVKFQGEVTAQTCQASIAGDTDGIVLLPTVPSSELQSPGATTGLTAFTIKVTDCDPGSGELKIKTKFQGIDTTTAGNLGNIHNGTDAAKGVSLQLTQNADGSSPVTLNGVTEVEGLVLEENKTETEHEFGVQYHADEAVTPGKVQSEANYTLSYD
jgi:major type 1 subunit fimbrin (pilin)